MNIENLVKPSYILTDKEVAITAWEYISKTIDAYPDLVDNSEFVLALATVGVYIKSDSIAWKDLELYTILHK